MDHKPDRQLQARFPELKKPAQAKWLSDDYVKFIRFAQWRIEKSGSGVLGFVTNHSYLDNPTFRGMRRSLMGTFDEIYLLDLHGNSKKKERPPTGGKDENVFDIQQGVAIGVFVKQESSGGIPAQVFHSDLWGERQEGASGGKYGWLAANSVASTQWTELSPRHPDYLFVPRNEELLAEYKAGWSVADIFSPNGEPAPGIITTHDQFAISWTAQEAASKVVRLLSTDSEDEARSIWRLCRQNQWIYRRAKEELLDDSWRDQIKPILYRPFDIRYTVFDRNVAVHRRERVMRHMLDGNNPGLCIGRAGQVIGSETWDILFISNNISEYNLFRRGGHCLFPLYIYPSKQEIKQGLYSSGDRNPNLDPRFTSELAVRLDLRNIGDNPGEIRPTVSPENVLHYIYAVLHSPTYRERYADFLRSEFPRVPLPDGRERFWQLAELGEKLSASHLLDGPALAGAQVGFPVPGENVVEPGHPKYVPPGETPLGETDLVTSGRVYFSRSVRARGGRPARQGQYFEGIEPDVWEFRIGGHQPMQKWLKDRKGRKLSFDDLTHYGRMAAALRETIRLMGEIDRVGVVRSE